MALIKFASAERRREKYRNEGKMSLSSGAESHVATECIVDSVFKGKWSSVPALKLGSSDAILRGGWLKTAIIHEENWLDYEIEHPESWVEALKANRIGGRRADIFTFCQKPPNTEPKYSYPKEWASWAIVPVTSFKEWWDALPQETRKNVRRSEKRGVTVALKSLNDELVTGIVGVNNDSPVRQDTPFDHYGKSFEQVWKDQSSYLPRSYFICAYVQEELIGFLKLVRCGSVGSILQILPKISHSDKRPANALIARAVSLCEEEKISYLVYGMLNYGNKKDSSLRDFKLRNGFREMLVPRYYAPLTAKGSLALKLGLHKGLLGILPPRVIKVAVSVRSRWYAFVKARRCSSTSERPNRIRQMERSIPPAGSSSVSEQLAPCDRSPSAHDV